MHEHVNIHILLSLLWDCVHIAVLGKVSSAERRVCYYRWFVQAHSPVCSTLELHKKVHSFFFGVVRLGGVWRGGGGVMFQEVGVCMGFQRGAG